MARPVTVAIAGISGYGDCYLDALLTDPRSSSINLIAAADPHSHKSNHLAALRARNIPVYDSAAALFANHSVDLFIVAAPIHAHLPLTTLALRHGASVLCEKPVAATPPDALRMLAAERAAAPEQFVAVGFQWSFSAAIRALKHDALAGVLGSPRRFASLAFFPRPHAYFTRNDWAGRLRTPAGHPVFDSPVNNATAHYLHNMFFVLGDAPDTAATPLTVRPELYRANTIESFDTAAVHCTFAGGIEALFYTSHATPARVGPIFRFEFAEATVTYDPTQNDGHVIARFHTGHSKSYGSPTADPFEKIWHCADAVRTGVRPPCTIETALPHTATVAALHQPHVPITAFPAALKRTITTDTHPMTVIDGLAETLAACYHEGVLPTRTRCFPWAPNPVTVPLRFSEHAHPAVAAPVAAL